MPNIVLPLKSIAQSVARPVIIDIVTQVQKLTGINPDTRIYYPGDIQRMKSAGTSIESKDRNPNFGTDRYNFIEVDEDFDVEALGTTAVTKMEHIPVFEDDKLRTKVTPVYATTNVVINFTFRCPSKAEAVRWRDEARVRITQMHDINLHSVNYHYLLPSEVLTVLKHIWDKREAKHGYEQTFEEYVTSYCTDRLTLVGDLVAKNVSLAISETQTRIQGMFTFEGLPEKAERDDASGTWQISFGYKFNYEKPISCHVQYPLMVHNQLLDDEYISFTDKAYDLNKVSKSFTASLHAMHAFEMHTIMNQRHNPEMVLKIPEYDDFVFPQTLHGSGTIMSILAEVDEVDKKTLFNLRELGDYVIDDDIMEFIEMSEYPYLGSNYKSILHVDMYRNEYMTSNNTLMCDASLNIKAIQALNLRNQHRVRLSVITDLTLLPNDAFKRLQRYPKALVKLIGSINELLRFNPDFTKLSDAKVISSSDFDSIYHFLTGYRTSVRHNDYYGHGIDTRNLFDKVDKRVIENYRKNAIRSNRVLISSIIASPKEMA